jgi:HK97 family phage major capsid protein
MTTPIRPPKDDLFRAMQSGVTSEDGRTLTIRLAPADAWAEIESVTEGHFMERFRKGAYRKTMAENPPKILFQHGRDPQIGEKIIATTDDVGEDEISPYARGQVLEGLPELLASGLRAGAYGSSHRFSVVRDDFNPKPKAGPHNPKGLPERTITEARLFELGPVTWPAYAQASASLRSLTDEFRLGDMTADPARLREIVAYIEPDAPSVDAAAEPHLEPERRETVAPPTIPTPERKPTMEYVTRDEKSSRVTELKAALSALAVEHPGVLPADAQERWDADSAELDALERDIKAWDERQARLAAYANDQQKVERSYEPVSAIIRKTETDIYDLQSIYRSARSVEDRGQKMRDAAMRAAEQLRVPSDRYDQDASRDRLTGLLDYRDSENKELARLVLATNSPQYRTAFANYVASGGIERGTALAVGVDATGGYSVPVSFDPTIVATGAWTAVNPYRASCRVETIVGTDTWQALTATAITAAWASEAAAATEQGPTFARPEFIAKRGHAYVTASYEMVQDRPGLPAELGQLFGEAKDTLEENSFTIGAGTTVYPQGIGLKDAFTRVDSITNDTFAVGDVYALAAALPIRERMNAAWYLSRAAIMAIQALETTGGQLFSGVNYAATPPPATRSNGNTGLTLLGFPVYETPSMPWTPTVDDTTWGVLMNPRNYVILDRVGASIRVIENVMDGATPSMPTGEVGIYFFWRGTARVLYVGGGRQGAIQ